MSQNQPTLPIPSAERLQEIRDADAVSGDLRWYPPAQTHRRELLLLIDQLTAPKPPQEVMVLALVNEDDTYPIGVYSSQQNLDTAAQAFGNPSRMFAMALTIDAPAVNK